MMCARLPGNKTHVSLVSSRKQNCEDGETNLWKLENPLTSVEQWRAPIHAAKSQYRCSGPEKIYPYEKPSSCSEKWCSCKWPSVWASVKLTESIPCRKRNCRLHGRRSGYSTMFPVRNSTYTNALVTRPLLSSHDVDESMAAASSPCFGPTSTHHMRPKHSTPCTAGPVANVYRAAVRTTHFSTRTVLSRYVPSLHRHRNPNYRDAREPFDCASWFVDVVYSNCKGMTLSCHLQKCDVNSKRSVCTIYRIMIGTFRKCTFSVVSIDAKFDPLRVLL